ncbi:MAG TPA: lanthionine synthetase C family protein [Chitinophaga sp.]|uniref:lanthionine synthetase C family protein n=1 Tax=Chitinophaga sp. TaxID=1869181 RepID=UPI002DC05582|nr:lanthionine synthetase C family protein [Chitinophaga sp.]HEU4555519.1 lanthionine synthetase C family protein [Chitinophaga sp.]
MQQIVHRQLDKLNALLEARASSNDTFLRGKLGLIFYYYHLYKVTEQPEIKHRTEEMLEQVLANISSAVPGLAGAALSTGGAGFAYTVDFMQRESFLKFEVDNEFEELDKYLFNTAAALIAEDNIDYLHGALGVTHYFASRENATPLISGYLDELVVKICARAVQEEAGCWFRNSLMKSGKKRTINLSLSHGLCGVLLVLINAYEKSSHKALILETVRAGVRFVLKHKMDVDFSRNEYTFFPFVLTQDAREISAPNRMGWCYGDLNQVLLFYRAGRLLDDDNLRCLADLIGTQSMMRRDRQSTMVTEAHFCHGTAGLAQFCKTLYLESGAEVYREAYEHWIERSVILLDDELNNGAYNGREHEFMEGLLGIAFVLLSYVSSIELEWSKAFLL